MLERIDQLNGQDPNRRELLYSQRLTEWVQRLDSRASEPLRIAARGQHVERWTIPRERYEMNRGGYLRWREDLKKYHAEKVGGIMKEAGFDEASIEKTKAIIGKKNLRDPDTQTIEDALCLVFLETQFADLRKKTPDEKMKEIIRKTWRKMSANGRTMALALDFAPGDRQLILESVKESGA